MLDSQAPRTGVHGGEHGPRHFLVVQRGEHGACRAGAVDHDRSQGGADRRFERRHPTVVDVDEIGERTEDPRRVTEHLGPGPGALVGDLARQRFGARLETVTLALGTAQRLLGVAQALLHLFGAMRRRSSARRTRPGCSAP